MFFKRREPRRIGEPAWDGESFALDDPRIPEPIRKQVASMAQPDWELYFADTDRGGEWWLFDDTGNLVEAFWLE